MTSKLKNIYIPYSRQYIDNIDINEVKKVLKSDFISQGPILKKFEGELIKFTGSNYVTLVNSGTSALHTACASLGLKKNDLLWTVPNSFCASSNCGLIQNAKVDFVDIDEQTYNISVDNLQKKLIRSKKNKKLPKILVIVHFAGNPCDLEKIYKLSKKYEFKIIEDASHAMGSKYKNIRIGNPKYSDAVITSFGPVKSITSAEGGAIFTNKLKDYNFNEIFRQSGVQKNSNLYLRKNSPGWWNEQQILGYNYKLSELHASLGRTQLRKISLFVKRRNILSKIYEEKLSKMIKFQKINKNSISARHLFVIRVNKKIHLKLFKFLRKNNIGVQLHYIPIYKHPYYQDSLGYKKKLVEAEKYYQEAISIPLYYGLKITHQKKVINLINNFIEKEN